MHRLHHVLVAAALVALGAAGGAGIANASSYASGGRVVHPPPHDHPCPPAEQDPYCGMRDPEPRYKTTPKDIN